MYEFSINILNIAYSYNEALQLFDSAMATFMNKVGNGDSARYKDDYRSKFIFTLQCNPRFSLYITRWPIPFVQHEIKCYSKLDISECLMCAAMDVMAQIPDEHKRGGVINVQVINEVYCNVVNKFLQKDVISERINAIAGKEKHVLN